MDLQSLHKIVEERRNIKMFVKAEITKNQVLSEKLKLAKYYDGQMIKNPELADKCVNLIFDNQLWCLDVDSAVNMLVHAAMLRKDSSIEEKIIFICDNYAQPKKALALAKLKNIA